MLLAFATAGFLITIASVRRAEEVLEKYKYAVVGEHNDGWPSKVGIRVGSGVGSQPIGEISVVLHSSDRFADRREAVRPLAEELAEYRGK